MNDDWDFYFCKVNDVVASISVDLGLRSNSKPLLTRKMLIWVWVKMKSPRGDGLSDSVEFDTLSAIEESIASVLQRKCDAIQVGRITTDGRKEFYFYAPSANNLEELVKEAMKKQPRYQILSGHKEDDNWTQYYELLYPRENQLQWISDRRTVDQLKARGDRLEIPRKVSHWIYFKSIDARDEYKFLVEREGFKIEHETFINKKGQDRPFCLQISRLDTTELQNINHISLKLKDLAKQINGDYDGWESPVIR